MENNLENVQESKIVDSNLETTQNETEVATETKEEIIEKSFTQEDIDRIINRTIAKERKKADEDKQEAEKLAKMSAEEKAKHEFEKQKLEFEEKLKSFEKKELELQITKELSSKNLPTEFSKYLLGNDAESSLENIKEFEVLFNNALDKHTHEKLKGSTPKIGQVVQGGGITKEQFKKMNIAERNNLAQSNIELYNILSKQ